MALTDKPEHPESPKPEPRELYAEKQEVVAALDRVGVALKSYLNRWGTGDEFGRDTWTLAEVIKTYRGVLDSLIV